MSCETITTSDTSTTCVICGSEITPDKRATISCDHSYCISCWQSWNSAKNHNATCPLCRKTPETDIVVLLYSRVLHTPDVLPKLINVCPDVGVFIRDSQIYYVFQLTTLEIKQQFRDALKLLPLKLKIGSQREHIFNNRQSVNYFNLLLGTNAGTTIYVIENNCNYFIFTASTYSPEPCIIINAKVREHQLLLDSFMMNRQSQILFDIFIEFIAKTNPRLIITGFPHLKFSIVLSPAQIIEYIRKYITTCAKCGKVGAMKRCSRCQCTYYCSELWQKDHWKKHKTICKKL